jgi:hypothetical protein
MLYDFPTPPQDINLQLYADDVNFYTTVKRTVECRNHPATLLLQKLSRKWKFKFSPAELTPVKTHYFSLMAKESLTKKIKFFGVARDTKLLWKAHIAVVINNCVKIKKNAFSFISKSLYVPFLKPLPFYLKAL